MEHRPPEPDVDRGAAGNGHGREPHRDAVLGGRVHRGATLARLSASTGAGYVTSRVRGLRNSELADQRFHAETAEKILMVLGSMKGAAMKLGQLASFVDLDLPPEVQQTYHEVLAGLRSAAPAFHSDAVAHVVADEYGAPPETVFARWDPEPIASASIGQVHRAALPDGAEVAVKVQYPGVAEAVESDLANAETFSPMARVISPNLDLKPLLEELRLRVIDELDYQREAQYQQAFHERYRNHPFIRVPRLHTHWCRPRVLVSEYMTGASFDEIAATASEDDRRRYGEILYRFAFGSIHRFRLFNADPHPGNYLFPGDGSVIFLDFGSVKLFPSAIRAAIQEQMRAVMAGDTDGLMRSLREARFLPDGHRTDPDRLMAWFRMFNRPVVDDQEWTYTPDFAREVIRTTTDPRAGYVDLLRKLNLPPDYLLLNRIQWGINSILGRLGATANWHRIMLEFWDGEPASPLGREEQAFIAASPYLA
jgi:predicted unusual protein kinase regulating ubiquinone biosynthesis (AarF/ABC1/UbiB family)